MENNNKSQAELYREERKERLAKAAAKNAKKSPMSIAKASEYCSKCNGTPPYGGCSFVVMFK